jgi:hypothetical protein
MPVPRSLGVTLGPNTSVRARVSRFATTRFAAGLTAPDCLSDSHHSAATPATWGQAMLVPLKLRKPPPTLADRMSTPGAATWAIVLEKSAISSLPPAPWPSAATETTPSAAAGKDAAIVLNAAEDHVRTAAAIVTENFADQRFLDPAGNTDAGTRDITAEDRSRTVRPMALPVAVP